jgi:hypothetical protein
MQEQKHEVRARKAKLAISYITCGTLMIVWSIIWLVYLTLPRDVSGYVYIASGVVLSGIAVVLIGMKVGDIGKEANTDEPEASIPATRPSLSTRKTDPSMIVEDPPSNRIPKTPPDQDIELETHRTAT